MKKVASGVTTIYNYDVAGNLISESEADGTPLRDIVYMNGERIAMRLYGSQAGWYYFVNDHLGTPQKIVNESGVVVWQAAYLPFGKAQVLAGSTIVNNFRFPGQYYDEETELHQNWHRYYMPAKGRYLTPDPVGLEAGINLYAYVQNNPLNYIDFFGLARYVIIVGDPGLGIHNTGTNFDRAANTRSQELRVAGHSVDVTRASDVTAFNSAITTGDTIDGGVIYYGHGWNGTLYIGETSDPGTNLDSSNISSLSNSNLGATATIELNSCNSGSSRSDGSDSIAQLVATQLGRNTSGWDRPLGFTGTPGNYLHGSEARPPATGSLYVVPTPGGRLDSFTP